MDNMQTLREALSIAHGKTCSYAKVQSMGGKGDERTMCTAPRGGNTEEGQPVKRYANCPYVNTSWLEARRNCEGYK